MPLVVADSFVASLTRLTSPEQRAVKSTAFELQIDHSGTGKQFHRLNGCPDPNFWSVRAGRDIRIIIHKIAASLMLAYADHHDKAYSWAERRRVEQHPSTGAVQFVCVHEKAEPELPEVEGQASTIGGAEPGHKRVFSGLTKAELLSVGVPNEWLRDVMNASEDGFFELVSYLPEEASEVLLEYAATGYFPKNAPVGDVEGCADPFSLGDSLRRFTPIMNADTLREVLDSPQEKWAAFIPMENETVHGLQIKSDTVVRGRVLITAPSRERADVYRQRFERIGNHSPRTISVAPLRCVADVS